MNARTLAAFGAGLVLGVALGRLTVDLIWPPWWIRPSGTRWRFKS